MGFVYEDMHGMFRMTDHLIGSDINELGSLQLLDFRAITVNDFYSFLAFNNVTDYMLICDGERIHRLVKFLNNNSKVRFSLFSTKLELLIGQPPLCIKNLTEKFPYKIDSQAIYNQETSSIKNELHLMLTGHYPLKIKDNQINHLYVENDELLICINNSVLKNCIINAIIFYDKCSMDISSELFPIMINFQKTKNIVESLNLIHRNKEEILEGINSFENSGVVSNHQFSSGIIDYTSVINIDRNNRLFFYEDGIYSDFSKKQLITNKFDDDFYVLVNYLSFKNTQRTSPAMRLFPMVVNISALLRKDHMYMVTPYNAFFSNYCLTKHKDFNLIGLVIDDQYFVYDVFHNKNYRVNKIHLLLLEFHLKENMDSIELQKYIPNKLKSFIEVFYEFIEKIT